MLEFFWGVSFVLPSNILSRFTIVRVESDAEALFVRSDEIASAKYVNAPNVESKESLSPVTARDFPIRDKAVGLIVRVAGGKTFVLANALRLPVMMLRKNEPATPKSLRFF